MRPNDLAHFKRWLIRQLCLLEFEPLLLRCAFFQRCTEWREMIVDGRIVVDPDLAFRDVDEEQALGLDAPTLDVLAAQERFEQFRRFSRSEIVFWLFARLELSQCKDCRIGAKNESNAYGWTCN
jgi:hypothetical protein